MLVTLKNDKTLLLRHYSYSEKHWLTQTVLDCHDQMLQPSTFTDRKQTENTLIHLLLLFVFLTN